MKTTLLAAALLALAAPAFAGEGNGDPFPFAAPGVTVAAGTQVADVGSEALPSFAGKPGSHLNVLADGSLPGTGSEALVQTANSLPRGFEVGTAASAYAQSVNRYFAAKADQNRVAVAARAASEPSRN